MKAYEEVSRIIYWWRRYCGIRDSKHDKIWLAKDINILERRLERYAKNKSKFNFNHPDMGIDEFGFEK